jgi:xanthine dioxygenase
MSPSANLPEPSFSVTPIAKTPKDKTNFGAVLEGLDLNDISGRCQLFCVVWS